MHFTLISMSYVGILELIAASHEYPVIQNMLKELPKERAWKIHLAAAILGYLVNLGVFTVIYQLATLLVYFEFTTYCTAQLLAIVIYGLGVLVRLKSVSEINA